MHELKVGSRLKIFADDDVYEGIIYSIDLKGTGADDRVTLHKATCLNSKKPLPSLIHFYTSDIKKFEILTEPKEASACNGPKLVDVCSKVIPSHLKHLRNIDHKKLSVSWQLGTKVKADTEEFASDSTVSTKDIEPEFTVIDTIDETFHSAIYILKKQAVIGLAVQGVCISRTGRLCWLQVGIKDHSLLFDMMALGSEAFDLGLREILESPAIQKVVYNCRSMSDMFCHQFNVLLINVFDIQVAEVTIFADNNGGCLPSYVNSLPVCLMEHLKLNADEVFFQRARMYNKEKDESVWAFRPATDEMLNAACKNVKYLRSLRRVMIEKLLRDFILGTDIYLAALRDLPDKEFSKIQSQSDSLPKDFYRLEHRSHQKPSAPKPQFVENCGRTRDPVLQVCHDGISHTRRRFSAKELDDWNQTKYMKARFQRSRSVGTMSRGRFSTKALVFT